MESLEERLESLKGKRVREDFLTGLYEDKLLSEAKFPYACIQAMDVMLTELAHHRNKTRHRTIGMVYANHMHELVPSKSKGRVDYGIRIYGGFFHLFSLRSERKTPLNLNIELDRTELNFSWNNEENNKKYEFDDLHYRSCLSPYHFKRSTGAALKKTTKRGEARLGGFRFNLSHRYKNTFVMIFFKKGMPYFFDLHGEKITPTNMEKYLKTRI